jgi:hypothetical protein
MFKNVIQTPEQLYKTYEVDERVRRGFYTAKPLPDNIWDAKKKTIEKLNKQAEFLLHGAEELGINISQTNFMDRVHENLDIYGNIKNTLKAYQKEQNDLDAKFRKELEKEFMTTINPKKDLLWEKVYEKGHASGKEEIYNVYADLVELIR